MIGCPLSLLIFNLVMEPLATHIRTNLYISGMKIGMTSHKISLFADDVILILTDTASSLVEVQKQLTWFSNVSYYKVNTTKSFILNINLDATTRNLLQLRHQFIWADKEISYLGVKLTRSVKHLFSVNFRTPTTSHNTNFPGQVDLQPLK